MSEILFPEFGDWEPTRETLHWYSRGVAAIARAHAKAQPKWWHISLKVAHDGLQTGRTGLPDGRYLWLKMELIQHKVIMFVDDKPFREFGMMNGLTSSEFSSQLLAAAAELGLHGPYEREKFENVEKREYDPLEVGKFLTSLVSANRIFEQHRSTLSGEKGPVQLWPHGFDLAFEWFGTRVEKFDNVEYPSQLNLGYFPGAPAIEPYFYSNPWPFEGELLLTKTLPEGASWFTDGWQGTILPYMNLAREENAEDKLLEYAQAVFKLTSPTLLAD